MSDIAIRVENLSKRYRIGVREEQHETLVGALASWVKSPVDNYRRLKKLSRFEENGEADDVIWALKDVSFEVKRGEVIGVIGRNGAGKSTLLKILSRITEPTSGHAEIHGRVSSLLEVGTGFHPELTGRENIYLNGAILGMTKGEIDRKFDEIVDFSGVEKFIDTPVKRYSSGMQVRLAFSVAAHLEPEILLVDEVLAVGDVAFQKKCLGKMEEVSGQGRTVLFVSHQLLAVERLCARCLVMNDGRIALDAEPRAAIQEYLGIMQQYSVSTSLVEHANRVGGELLRFSNVRFFESCSFHPVDVLASGMPVTIELEFECYAEGEIGAVVVAIAFFEAAGGLMFACRSDTVDVQLRAKPGVNRVYCTLPKWPLSAGRYYYNINARYRGTLVDWVKEAGFIDVESGDYYGTGRVPAESHRSVYVDFDWSEHVSIIATT